MKLKSRPGRASLVRFITASSALLFGASSMVVADDDDKINILRAVIDRLYGLRSI